MHRMNPDSLRSCPCFRVFRLDFASNFFNLLLVRLHQAELIVVKHLIQGRNNVAWVGAVMVEAFLNGGGGGKSNDQISFTYSPYI